MKKYVYDEAATYGDIFLVDVLYIGNNPWYEEMYFVVSYDYQVEIIFERENRLFDTYKEARDWKIRLLSLRQKDLQSEINAFSSCQTLQDHENVTFGLGDSDENDNSPNR